MFWFLLIALVVVVAAVTLAVVGGGDGGASCRRRAPDRLADPLPADRPVGRADVEALRLPVAAARLPDGGRRRRAGAGSARSWPSGTPGSPSWSRRWPARRPRRRRRGRQRPAIPTRARRGRAGADVSAAAPWPGPDGRLRCPWGLSTEDYVAYHDTEWGRPVHGDDALFERLCLEAFQSGLSWITILRRREGFRAAFAGLQDRGGRGVHRRRRGAAARRPRDHPQPRQDRGRPSPTRRSLAELADGRAGRADLVLRPRPGDAPGPAHARRRPGGHRRSPRRWPRTSRSAASASSAPPRPTP